MQGLILVAFVAAAAWGPEWPPSLAALQPLGFLLALIGAVACLAALSNLGKSLTAMPKPLEGAVMKTTGMYALARHPIYGGLLIALLGGSLATSPAALVPTAGLALLFEGKRRVEERWLLEHFDGYEDYMRHVPRVFVPYVW